MAVNCIIFSMVHSHNFPLIVYTTRKEFNEGGSVGVGLTSVGVGVTVKVGGSGGVYSYWLLGGGYIVAINDSITWLGAE